MKHSQLKKLIKEEIRSVLELHTIDYKPKDDLVHLYLMTYSDKVGEPYFERKYKKFRNDVESLLQSFDAAVEDDHGISDKNLKILVNRKDKTKIKNILSKLSNRYGFESELEIDTLEEIRSVLNEAFIDTDGNLQDLDLGGGTIEVKSDPIKVRLKASLFSASLLDSPNRKEIIEKFKILIKDFFEGGKPMDGQKVLDVLNSPYKIFEGVGDSMENFLDEVNKSPEADEILKKFEDFMNTLLGKKYF